MKNQILLFGSVITFLAILIIALSGCKKDEPNLDDSVLVETAVDSISDADAAILEACIDTVFSIEEIYLDNGQSVNDFLLQYDPNFLQNYSSGKTTETNLLSPADQLHLFLSRMTAVGNYLIYVANHSFSQGQNGNEPAQTGLAYSYGSKDFNIRQAPPAGQCTDKKIYGLDCSGMMYTMTTLSGLPPIVPKNQFNVANTSDVNKWNTAFENSTDFKDLYISDLGLSPSTPLWFGDIIIWPNAPHIGMVIGGYIYQSNGSGQLPACQQNMASNKGPRAIPFSALTWFGGGVYRVFRPMANNNPAAAITDIDGNVYNTVTIGTQTWMKENLKTSHYRDGSLIPTNLDNTNWQNTTSGAYTVFDYNQTNNDIYGKLYNWYAVNDSRGICPQGWHAPSDAEWQILIDYVGGDAIAAGALKAINLWNAPNLGASNSSSFSALPGGYRNPDGTFTFGLSIGYRGSFWSSSEMDSEVGYSRILIYDYLGAYQEDSYKSHGMSCRCVKD